MKSSRKATVADAKGVKKSRSFAFQVSGLPSSKSIAPSQVLVIDVGGTHVKILASGIKSPTKFASGSKMTAEDMVLGVLKVTKEWKFNAVSIGYPGAVLHGRPIAEPYELGDGWVGFNFDRAFGCPVTLINDAVMQAIGSYEGGKMLFLGLGTGLGSTMFVVGVVEPMELAHLPYKHLTYEDYIGKRGLKRLGKRDWRKSVEEIVSALTKALEPDYIVIGGGNVKKLKDLPENCRWGDNANAFEGGFRLWSTSGWSKRVIQSQ